MRELAGRLRWDHVVRLGLVAGAVALVAAWPRLAPEGPVLPAGEVERVVAPPAVPEVAVAGEGAGAAPGPGPGPRPRRRAGRRPRAVREAGPPRSRAWAAPGRTPPVPAPAVVPSRSPARPRRPVPAPARATPAPAPPPRTAAQDEFGGP